MPVLILVDVSLSMLAPLETSISSSNFMADSSTANRRTASLAGVSAFLEYLEINSRQELVSLAAFSDIADVTEFTKDYASLRQALDSDAYQGRSKTNIVDALRGGFYRCVAVWGSNVLCHVIVVTDCAGFNSEFEQLINALAVLEGRDPVERPASWSTLNGDDRKKSSDLIAPMAKEFYQLIRRGSFTFHVICVNSSGPSDQIYQYNIQLCKKLIEFFDCGGTLRSIDDPSLRTSISLFQTMADELTAPSTSTLRCGSFASAVDVFPNLRPIRKETDFGVITGKLGIAITVLGFLRPLELGSPPITSRHLLLGAKRNPNAENVDPAKRKTLDDDKSPNFCVLLHGAMASGADKGDDMVAICEIGTNWYGYIHRLTNAKERSNLILHCFEPGIDAVPWLGPLNKLVPRPFLGPPAQGAPTPKSPFPITFKTKPSYATAISNWIHGHGLQADIQKLLRYAKKLPEKEQQFYQELSRICNAALAIGFKELLIQLARVFEKESLTSGSNSPAGIIMKNVVSVLVSDRLKYGEPLSALMK